jgi:hypothetical protein
MHGMCQSAESPLPLPRTHVLHISILSSSHVRSPAPQTIYDQRHHQHLAAHFRWYRNGGVASVNARRLTDYFNMPVSTLLNHIPGIFVGADSSLGLIRPNVLSMYLLERN